MDNSIVKIFYRLQNGQIIDYNLDLTNGLSVHDIEKLCLLYVENSMCFPENAYIEFKLFAEFAKKLIRSSHAYSPNVSQKGIVGITLRCSGGTINLIPKHDPYIPILVGSDVDYQDNNFYDFFEKSLTKED